MLLPRPACPHRSVPPAPIRVAYIAGVRSDDGPVAGEPRSDWDSRKRKFGSALRQVLKDRGLTQTAFALDYGAAPATVSQWVTGRSVPDPPDVFRLEEELGLPPATLSRHLGFQPFTTDLRNHGTSSVPDAVRADPLLDEPIKEGLLAYYRTALRLRRAHRRG